VLTVLNESFSYTKQISLLVIEIIERRKIDIITNAIMIHTYAYVEDCYKPRSSRLGMSYKS
jgi:hypothetical protein